MTPYDISPFPVTSKLYCHLQFNIHTDTVNELWHNACMYKLLCLYIIIAYTWKHVLSIHRDTNNYDSAQSSACCKYKH